jgi:hypothetical protein
VSAPTPVPGTNPAPLTTAASLVAVEGIVVTLLAVAELSALTGGRLTMGLTTALFFAIYGVGLIGCAWAVTRRVEWARGPILLAQLIQLGLAWSFWGGATTIVSVTIALVAVVVLIGMLHPASMAVLGGREG